MALDFTSDSELAAQVAGALMAEGLPTNDPLPEMPAEEREERRMRNLFRLAADGWRSAIEELQYMAWKRRIK
jgi:hypothetical protein